MKAFPLLLGLLWTCSTSAVYIKPRADSINILTSDPEFPLAELENYFSSRLEDKSATTSLLSTRDYTTDTSKQLTDGTPCRKITIIYARGTSQAGNLGATNTLGPVFLNAIVSLVGADNLAVQGVDYAANAAGFLVGGDPAGSKTLVQLTERVCYLFLARLLLTCCDSRLLLNVPVQRSS